MQIANRFSIAIHICAYIGLYQQTCKVTSELLAESTNVNPVIIRRVLQQLKSAGILEITRGVGGAKLAKNPESITLKDIYYAVESNGKTGKMFSMHSRDHKDCPIGQSIEQKMNVVFDELQNQFDAQLSKMTLALFSVEMKCPNQNN